MAAQVRTLGVEEEFLLFRDGSARLAPVGEAVAHEATRRGTGQFEHEFKQPQAELATAPSVDLTEVADQLRDRRAELAAAARARDARLVAVGTSPVQDDAATTPHSRYRRMDELFGPVAVLNLTCGMHVHVGLDSDEERVGAVDRMQPWLPALTALSANSPFWGGDDTTYDSYRSIVWRQWPTAGGTQPFGSPAAYREAQQQLIRSGAALDEGMVYYSARLAERYPTVEVRVSDVCARSADAATIAGLTRALVSTAAEQWAEGRPAPRFRHELLRAAYWRAARFGVRERLVDPVDGSTVSAWDHIETLLEMVRPALDAAGDTQRVTEGLERIRSRGTGAALQRATRSAGSLSDVVDALAEATTEASTNAARSA
ncbi:carboxylate-amine ligase [Desertihabitans brevis]|uniref:carboxylate-amine ligase n=1 Tax=Desertihabitans brevis TaxID=2268447 RepID=UPI00131470B1|nr:glutamate--cysteine ligase [Desertihabitans brevis]